MPTPTITEKELKNRLEHLRDVKGTAHRALEKADNIRAPKSAHDELKDLRRALHETEEHSQDRIDDVRKRLAHMRNDKGSGKEVIKWAEKQIGKTEQPYGSNLGPFPITECQQFLGYAVPDANGHGVFWCGCFAGYAVIKIGGAAITTKIRLGYGPSIIADAHAGANGLRAVKFSEIKAGDILVYWGGSHIGLANKLIDAYNVRTIEGNTVSGVSGDQSNGGGIFGRQRTSADVTVVARPTYAN